tara:strand:+ start:5949 stop:7649 length:1701 start_codon:yes stop_codon:yes gene_type:complete
MNNPLQRKMFREAGMSKQPVGILASSPELMNAAKGYEKGGTYQDRVIREAQNYAPEFSFQNIPAAIPDIPILGRPKFKMFNSPGENDGLGEIGTSKIGDTLKEEKDKKAVENQNIEPNIENINNTNKNILDKKNEEEFDVKKLMPFGQNLNVRGKQELSATEDPNLASASGDVTTAMQKVATATTKDFKDTNIAGTTYNKAINDLTSQINKEGREIGLDDVYDEGIKLLNYDPRDLEKNYDADRRQAFWFNLMNAGLQIAAGESSNALTNVAKGLGSGLQSFGKDVGELKSDLREDRKESTNVMYRLLGNKRSEQLAKEALELDKKAKIFNITQTEVGQMRSTEIAKANAEFEEKKFNLNYLVELKKMDQTEKLSENKIKAALQNAMINNKAISVPFMLGLITPKDGFTKDTVDISDPNSYSFTPEGIKIAKDIYDNTRTYKPTNREQSKKENLGKATGPAGIVFAKPSDNDGTLATNWDQNINSQFVKDVSTDPENAAKLLLGHVSQYQSQGAQIDLKKLKGLYPEIHRYLTTDKDIDGEIQKSPLSQMPSLFKNSNSVDLSNPS